MATNITISTINGIKVHNLIGLSPASAYDHVQSSGEVSDGEVILLAPGKVAIMVEAWPTMYVGNVTGFHAGTVDWDVLADGKYLPACELAGTEAIASVRSWASGIVSTKRIQANRAMAEYEDRPVLIKAMAVTVNPATNLVEMLFNTALPGNGGQFAIFESDLSSYSELKVAEKLEANLSRVNLQTDIDGHAVSISVSPCSWMNDNYGLQIQVTINATMERAIHHTKKVNYQVTTVEDMLSLASKCRVVSCPKCGKPAFSKLKNEYHDENECEVCRLARLKAEFEQAEQEDNAKLAEQDAAMKAKGYTHRVDAYIHPEGGSDDQFISLYMVRPTKAGIKSELKKRKSITPDDYVIIKL